jgi:hypothetical protein
MICLSYGKEVMRLKLHLLAKLIMLLLVVCVGIHPVSIAHLQQPVNHGKLVAVENEKSSVTTNLQVDDQKHVDFPNSFQARDYVILVLTITSLLIFSSCKSRRRIKHFLYSVYYQSSYFSRNHLFTP